MKVILKALFVIYTFFSACLAQAAEAVDLARKMAAVERSFVDGEAQKEEFAKQQIKSILKEAKSSNDPNAIEALGKVESPIFWELVDEVLAESQGDLAKPAETATLSEKANTIQDLLFSYRISEIRHDRGKIRAEAGLRMISYPSKRELEDLKAIIKGQIRLLFEDPFGDPYKVLGEIKDPALWDLVYEVISEGNKKQEEVGGGFANEG